MPKLSNGLIVFLLAVYLGFTHLPKDGIKIPDSVSSVFNIKGLGGNTIVPVKERVVAEPSAELKALAQPVVDIINKSTSQNKAKEALALGDFYGDFGKVLVTPGNVIKSKLDLKETLREAGKMHFGVVKMNPTDYPGYTDAIDTYFEKALGLEATLLDNPKTINALNALQWSVYQTAK
jgi:hypothetical protein